jgi:hypothetical protein
MGRLAKQYKRMIDTGMLVPAEKVGDFRYPSALTEVPTFTTYGVADKGYLSEEQLAELEPNTK